MYLDQVLEKTRANHYTCRADLFEDLFLIAHNCGSYNSMLNPLTKDAFDIVATVYDELNDDDTHTKVLGLEMLIYPCESGSRLRQNRLFDEITRSLMDLPSQTAARTDGTWVFYGPVNHTLYPLPERFDLLVICKRAQMSAYSDRRHFISDIKKYCDLIENLENKLALIARNRILKESNHALASCASDDDDDGSTASDNNNTDNLTSPPHDENDETQSLATIYDNL